MKYMHNLGGDQIRSIIERVEKLEEEKAAIGADIREVFAEAKGNGYDVKTLRKVIKLRKLDVAQRQEEEHLLQTYQHALGMLPDFEENEPSVPPAGTETSSGTSAGLGGLADEVL